MAAAQVGTNPWSRDERLSGHQACLRSIHHSSRPGQSVRPPVLNFPDVLDKAVNERPRSRYNAKEDSLQGTQSSPPSFSASTERLMFTRLSPFPKNTESLRFGSAGSPYRPRPRGVKRARSACDVDGPNTALLSCKKRRLRTELITSRLSQPFSQPATHILNREGIKAGDRRFLKMATKIDTVRRISHLHSTSILKYSIFNSIKKKLGDGEYKAVNNHHYLDGARRHTMTASAWIASGDVAGEISTRPAGIKDASNACTLVNRHKVDVRPANSQLRINTCHLSKPAALPLLLADAQATEERTSLRIQPSLDSVPSGDGNGDDVEDDPYVLRYLEDSSNTDDTEIVYSDFNVIFSGHIASGESPSPEEHSYEKYFDELDGISWVPR